MDAGGFALRNPLTERCPTCKQRSVWCSSDKLRHSFRVLIGSRKRWCATCGDYWHSELPANPAHPAPLALTLAAAAIALSILGQAEAPMASKARNLLAASLVFPAPEPEPRMIYLAVDTGRRVHADMHRAQDYRFPILTSGWPRVSSRYGLRMHPILLRERVHRGIDLPQRFGTPVFPARAGKVVRVGKDEEYGNFIVIRHDDGWSTLYGHLARVTTAVGRTVDPTRDMIGAVGSTGLSTGPHLHFEIRNPQGKSIDPDAYLTP